MAGVNSRLSMVTEEEVLQMLTFLEYVVLSPSFVFTNTSILFNLGATFHSISENNYQILFKYYLQISTITSTGVTFVILFLNFD